MDIVSLYFTIVPVNFIVTFSFFVIGNAIKEHLFNLFGVSYCVSLFERCNRKHHSIIPIHDEPLIPLMFSISNYSCLRFQRKNSFIIVYIKQNEVSPTLVYVYIEEIDLHRRLLTLPCMDDASGHIAMVTYHTTERENNSLNCFLLTKYSPSKYD